MNNSLLIFQILHFFQEKISHGSAILLQTQKSIVFSKSRWMSIEINSSFFQVKSQGQWLSIETKVINYTDLENCVRSTLVLGCI
ncbi:hypothetical protein Pint_11103 [Pistacia integerrima]|uniref:Uncharacterized protein n=1 Tax=Pistacia integerrima TaxID=434235 RepID=A0ACC0XK16_9ROSI|nr:hypothetical protein Pint_11103 [Pistacia integerrima]